MWVDDLAGQPAPSQFGDSHRANGIKCSINRGAIVPVDMVRAEQLVGGALQEHRAEMQHDRSVRPAT